MGPRHWYQLFDYVYHTKSSADVRHRSPNNESHKGNEEKEDVDRRRDLLRYSSNADGAALCDSR
jgi:hypothetical protein